MKPNSREAWFSVFFFFSFTFIKAGQVQMLYIKTYKYATRDITSSGPRLPSRRRSPKHRSPLNVQRAVCWPHVADSDQQDVDQRPYPQAAEAEELAEAFSPLAQVEPVCAEATEGDAQSQGR